MEVNATFFRMIDPTAVAAWAEQTPDGFMLSLKAHRFISSWLRNPDKAEAQGFARHAAMAQPLVDAGKFVAYLLQFPGKLSAQMDLERSLAVLREGFRRSAAGGGAARCAGCRAWQTDRRGP